MDNIQEYLTQYSDLWKEKINWTQYGGEYEYSQLLEELSDEEDDLDDDESIDSEQSDVSDSGDDESIDSEQSDISDSDDDLI